MVSREQRDVFFPSYCRHQFLTFMCHLFLRQFPRKAGYWGECQGLQWYRGGYQGKWEFLILVTEFWESINPRLPFVHRFCSWEGSTSCGCASTYLQALVVVFAGYDVSYVRKIVDATSMQADRLWLLVVPEVNPVTWGWLEIGWIDVPSLYKQFNREKKEKRRKKNHKSRDSKKPSETLV